MIQMWRKSDRYIVCKGRDMSLYLFIGIQVKESVKWDVCTYLVWFVPNIYRAMLCPCLRLVAFMLCKLCSFINWILGKILRNKFGYPHFKTRSFKCDVWKRDHIAPLIIPQIFQAQIDLWSEIPTFIDECTRSFWRKPASLILVAEFQVIFSVAS